MNVERFLFQVQQNLPKHEGVTTWIEDSALNVGYQVRNAWMVDRANLVIAVFNGQKSWTKNTVEYAKCKRIPVDNVLQ